MTDQQKRWAEKHLALGCKGVTCVNIGDTPKHQFCYKRLELAKEKQKALNKGDSKCCAQIYSIHLWNDLGKDRNNPDVTFDNKGKANMRNWDESGRDQNSPNFDFGFLTPQDTVARADAYHNPDKDGDGEGDYFDE